MLTPKKYNIILSWLPSRDRNGVIPKASTPYFVLARTAIEKLLQKKYIPEVQPNYSPQEEIMTTSELGTDDNSEEQYTELEDFIERDCIHAIIYLASDYAHYDTGEQEYSKVQKLPETSSLYNIAHMNHTSKSSTLTLDEIDELNLELHGSRNPIELDPFEVKKDFDNIVKIIIPVKFLHKYRINDERSIYNGIQGILGQLFQDDQDAEINLNVLIGGGTSAMRTIWLFTKYNKLFNRGGHDNLSIKYWDNQQDDNSQVHVKEAFIMEEVGLIQDSTPAEQQEKSDYNDLPAKYKDKPLKEAVSLFEVDIINHYMKLYHQDKHHVGKQLGYDQKTISNKLKNHKPHS